MTASAGLLSGCCTATPSSSGLTRKSPATSGSRRMRFLLGVPSKVARRGDRSEGGIDTLVHRGQYLTSSKGRTEYNDTMTVRIEENAPDKNR